MALRRGERTLVSGFELTVGTGEIVAVQGASGAGKTTLLRAIAGLIPPERGRVELDGHTPRSFGWPVFRSRVTYVGQQPMFVEGTVRENLVRAFDYTCRREPFPEETAVKLLEDWQLSLETLEQPAAQLSVGEQQRVALIRALLTRPWFLLLDEPTSALDAKTASRVLKHVNREARQGAFGALVVSHDESLLEGVISHMVEFPGQRK